MSARLDGVFLVTGSASGIGLCLTELLLERGARVVATDLRLGALEERARSHAWPAERVRLQALDVRDPAAWESAVERAVTGFGRLDTLMNVAGCLQPRWVREIRDEDVHLQLDVNLKGVIFGTRAAARRMSAQGSGHVVNVASLAALVPVPGMSVYSASKYAVRSFSLAAAQELARDGIAVTVVCPDGVRTPMLAAELDYPETALVFSGTMLEASDVARAVLDQALRDRPLELYLPRARGWSARLGDLWPRLFFRLDPWFRRKGLRRQAELKKRLER